jgi:Bacterial regulatory proteins, luxR family
VQEGQTARLATDGHSNPQIGAQLFLSARTVEFHLHKVYTQLGIRSRRELHTAWPPSARRTRRPRGRPSVMCIPASEEQARDVLAEIARARAPYLLTRSAAWPPPSLRPVMRTAIR